MVGGKYAADEFFHSAYCAAGLMQLRTYYTVCCLLSDTAKADIRYTPSSSPKGIELSAANPPSPFLCKVHCQHPRERKEEEEEEEEEVVVEEEEEGPLRGEKCSLGPFSKG